MRRGKEVLEEMGFDKKYWIGKMKDAMEPVWVGGVPTCSVNCTYCQGGDRNCDPALLAEEEGAPEMCHECEVCLPAIHFGKVRT